MKTILFALEFPPAVGGMENYYGQLAHYWPDELVIIDNHHQELINKRLWFLNWLPAFKKALTIARTAKPDWFLASDILPIGTALWLAAHLVKLRYAVFLHGLDFSLATKTAWKKYLARHILRRANLIFCANSRTAQLVSEFLGSAKDILIVNPGIDPQKPLVRPELVASLKENYGLERETVLISIGRLIKRKGVTTVLSVLPSVLEKNPHLRYVIIGQGPEEPAIRQMISDPALAAKVIFLTEVTDAEKWAWLEVSDIFIMPAKELANGDYEGFGIVYLEANLFAKPVIAGKSGGVVDAVTDNLNGLLVDPENAAQISEAIIKLASDPALAARLGQQGQARALKDFAWPDKVGQIHLALKNKLL